MPSIYGTAFFCGQHDAKKTVASSDCPGALAMTGRTSTFVCGRGKQDGGPGPPYRCRPSLRRQHGRSIAIPLLCVGLLATALEQSFEVFWAVPCHIHPTVSFVFLRVCQIFSTVAILLSHARELLRMRIRRSASARGGPRTCGSSGYPCRLYGLGNGRSLGNCWGELQGPSPSPSVE